MESVLRSVKKRKKSRRLGEVDIVRREEYAELDVDSKVEMIRALVPLGLMHVHELLDEEVTELAGERYARKEAFTRGGRHGSNPGTVGLAGLVSHDMCIYTVYSDMSTRDDGGHTGGRG